MKKLSLMVAVAFLSVPVFAADADADAAKAMLKKNDCFKCHALDKKKDGPSYKKVAEKHKGKADAEEKLFKHVTTSPMVEIDGKKEEHKAIKGGESDIRNTLRWILSL